MNKQDIMNLLITDLEQNLKLLIMSAFEAKQAATSEESKAENKYDTRGLEASYLAGAQALRAKDLEFSIGQLKRFHLREFFDNAPVDLTALVEVEINEDETKMFFILPFAGGSKIFSENTQILVVTPESPMGRSLMGKNIGDVFMIKTKNTNLEYKVLNVF